MGIYDAEDRDLARLQILDAYDSYVQKAHDLGATPSVPLFLRRYHQGRVPAIASARRVVPTLHLATMHRWLARRASGGKPALISRYGNRRGSGILDQHPSMRSRLIELARAATRRGAPQLHAILADEFPRDRIPSVKTIQRFLADHIATSTLD